MARWIGFFVAIVIGVAAGLYYGWAVNPVEYIDTSPDSLRIDYRTDYVLMVAEVYHVEEDLAQAARRLAILGDDSPHEIVQQAILYANQIGYSENDRVLLADLRDGLLTWNPVLEAPET